MFASHVRFAVCGLALFTAAPFAAAVAAEPGPRFVVRFAPGLRSAAVTGRVFVALSRTASPEPRLRAGELATSLPFFGVDIDAMAPRSAVVIDAATPGYPPATLRDVPAGDYYAQAIVSVYTRYPRADGHVIYAHQDGWEGQQFGTSPGNLIGPVVRVHLDPHRATATVLRVTRAIPPIALPRDTAWVKHVKIRSALLTSFWGVPQYLGATVLLPKGYADDAQRRYPAVYEQGHFTLRPPLGFDETARPESAEQRDRRLARGRRESRYEFTRAWKSGDAPALVAITLQHPTPYYDDSYAVDSVNNGPYGTAIMRELIPYLERRFRLEASGRARFLIGGSTGGWEALALQIYHPLDFNGAWGLYPDPVDFHRFQLGDLYVDANAFTTPFADWNVAEIGAQRRADGLTVETMRRESRLEFVRGSHGRSGEQFNAWDAAWGPIGADGYPRELWDKHRGIVDRGAVRWSRDHGYDLTDYVVRNWPRLAPALAGKLHVEVGDDDDYYLNLAVYRMDAALAKLAPAANAKFVYGRPLKPHGFQARSTVEYLREMSARFEVPVATP